MGTRAYVVKGKGNPASLNSAAHGAGRVMSRKQAKKTFNYAAEMGRLLAQGITVLSAGADEVVGVYKDIEAVMDAQQDLVEKVATFRPKIVKMCGGNERAED
jgi:tRNA-splicing ligase RtcB